MPALYDASTRPRQPPLVGGGDEGGRGRGGADREQEELLGEGQDK